MSSKFARHLDNFVYKRAQAREDFYTGKDGTWLPFERQGSVSGLSSASLLNYNFFAEVGPKQLLLTPDPVQDQALVLYEAMITLDAATGTWAASSFMTGTALTSGLRLAYHNGTEFISDFWRIPNLSTTVPWPKTNRNLVVKVDRYDFTTDVGLAASGILRLYVDFKSKRPPLYLPPGHSLRLLLASGDTAPATGVVYMYGRGIRVPA